MIKNIVAGFWVCAIALGSCYGAAMWTVSKGAPEKKGTLVGLQYKKLPVMNVPVIVEGSVQGYVVATFVFTADADTLRSISIPADAIVQDEAFRYIYSDGSLDFRKLSRYDVNGMIAKVRANVNKRLGAEIVQDILIENFNFIDKSDIRS